LLKRIMMTCQATDFANVSLAVNRTKALPPDATIAGVDAGTLAAAAPGGSS
jgi:hypothetical protein